MPPCPAPDTCWLYLIRHGATANNDARPSRLQGRRSDQPLSAAGIQQAQQTARWLGNLTISAVFSSPLLRARQTAEIIASPHGLSIQTVDDLIEVDVGVWEGCSCEEIEQAHPEAYRLFMADASQHPYLGGEDFSAVQARAVPALERLMAAHLGRTIVAVSHNGVHRACLAHFLRMPLGSYRSIPQHNCGINLIEFRGGQARLVTLNAVSHLVEGIELPTTTALPTH
jgi:broad specificity phosphatase PhoE